MLIEFSRHTFALLTAELSAIKQLAASNENETQIDLSRIKKLKGYRTELVKNWLKCIQKLDQLTQQQDPEKLYALKKINALIEALKHYENSCEYYPRVKDFLNIIPDNTSEIVGLTFIASGFIAYLFPPFLIVPLLIISWTVLDLVFNNRTAAKTLEACRWATEEEVRTIHKANLILKPASLLTVRTPISSEFRTLVSPEIAIPNTSRAYSPSFFCSVEDQSIENKFSPTNSMFASFSSTSSSSS